MTIETPHPAHPPIHNKDDLHKVIDTLADRWFKAQLRYPEQPYYFCYRRTSSLRHGTLVICSRPCAETDGLTFTTVFAMSPAWTRDQGRHHLWEAAQRLPILANTQEGATS